MKRSLRVFSIVIYALSITLPCGCDGEGEIRCSVRVSLEAPHPWENGSGTDMWYTLVWNDGNSLRKLMVSGHTEPIISIPLGKTTIVCAFPLGELFPSAGAWTPHSGGPRIVLTQREGALGELLLSLVNGDAAVIESLDYHALVRAANAACGDMRKLALEVLACDLLNGSLSEDSFVLEEDREVVLDTLPSGRWVSERREDGEFWTGMGLPVPHVRLSPGKYRYLCASRHTELVIVVEDNEDEVFIGLRTRYL